MQSILKRKHLSLFRNTNTPIDSPRRLSQDSLVDRATTTADGPATSMKNSNINGIAYTKRSHPGLSLMELPVGGEYSTIFAAVRVAQHHLLLRVTGGQPITIIWVGEGTFQDIRTGA